MKTIREDSEVPEDVVLLRYKRSVEGVGGRGGGGVELTPPSTPPCSGELRETAILHGGSEDGGSPRDSRSSHSSGNSGRTVGSSDGASEGNHDNGDATYEAVLTATHLHSSNTHSKNSDCVGDVSNGGGGKGMCELSHSGKPELKGYLGKSMLPGLSGLHGLSSLRQTPNNIIKPSHSKNTPENPTENNMRHSSHSANRNSGVSNGSTGEDIAWVSRRLQAHRQLSSSDSWGSEDFESYSSNEEDGGSTKNEAADKGIETSVNSSKISMDSKISTDSVGSSGSIAASSAGREKLKARLLRKREQWRERRQSSSKEFKQQQQQHQLLLRKESKEGPRDAGDCGRGGVLCGSIEDVHGVPGGADAGKLSRWFSLRKSVNYDLDRKGGTSNNSTAASNPGHPVAGVSSVSTSSSKGAAAIHEDIGDASSGSNNLPNSATLSSISSFSSSSSTSTNSSSSSPFVTPHQHPHHHGGAHHNPSLRLPQLLELEERMSELEASTNPSNFYHNTCGGLSSLGTNTFQRRHQPPSLPPIPTGLSPDQIKRRHIVASIVHSENNYVATLHRLVREYRKPLEESKPPILNQSKVSILFHYVHEILQCHTLFRIALTECVRHWDRDEKIGDVFFASFSKGVVLDIYSEFINNFTRAMELAKMESRKKSVFADFLKMRQITSPDRLSFFGMMVKPVQRFPQFILFLQDLLKYTPKGHPDRMSLQLALTQLESLAETLNEQKRESEQHQAFKATLKQINSKFALRSICEGNRCLIRQDDVTKLEFGPNGLIKQTKERRLFLTTDAVICVSVVPRGTVDEFGGGGGTNERLSLKWVHPVTEVEVQENNSSLTLSRLLAAGLSQRPSSGTIPHHTSVSSTKQGTAGATAPSGGAASVYDIYSCPALRVGGGEGGVGLGTSLEESEAMVGAICAEMNELMHDYQVVSRIAGLADTLKGSYDPLTTSSLQGVLSTIQEAIQARDDRMSWLDGCCLQVRAGKELITFHVRHPVVKKDWIIELRLAQLAVSSVNSPAWDSGYPHQGGDGSHQRPPSRRPPLFVTALPLLHAAHHTQVVCGCQYPLVEYPKIPSLRGGGGLRPRGGKNVTSVWVCSTDGVTSHLTRYVTHHGALRECTRVRLAEVCVTGMLHVPPPHCPPLSPHTSSAADPSPSPLTLDTVWIGTLQNRLLVYSGSTPDSQQEISNTELPAAVSALIYHCEQVFIGLTDGTLLAYCRSPDDMCWQLAEPVSLKLSDNAPIKALLPLAAQLYAAVADTVLVLDCSTLMLVKQLSVHHGGSVSLLAHSGIGLWVCEEGAPSTVCLYHTESCRHLQDIDLAPSVARVLGVPSASCSVVVTGLVVSRGLLWVGTSVGVTLTLPLPRLQGVPIISGRPTLSYHAHAGPVTFLMTLMPPEYYVLPSKGVTYPDNKGGVHAPASDVRVDEGRQRTAVDGNSDNISDAAGSSSSNNNNRTGCDISNTGSGNQNSQVGFGVSSGSDLRREALRKASTLPRGFGGGGGVRSALMGIADDVPGTMGVSTTSSSDEGAVMGVCGELLRHWGDDHAVVGCGGDREASDALRRSDPSLSGVTSSTLDRRLRLRAGRPRSLDLSSVSIDSKVSAATASSGGSEECYGVNFGLLQSRQSTILEDSHDSVSEKGQSRRNSSAQEAEVVLQQQNSDDKVTLEEGDSNIKYEQDKENVSCEERTSEVRANSEDSTEFNCQISTDSPGSEVTAQPDCTIPGEVEDKDLLAKETVPSENLKISEESGYSTDKLINESRSSPSSSSRKSLSSDSGASRHSLKVSSRHRRSSSDATQKSLSSSASNVSSLYYEGDLETSDAACKTNSASDPKRKERNEDSECSQVAAKPEEPQRITELANLSRKPSVTSTTNKKNAGTLSRSPTTKSSSSNNNNGKGDGGKEGCRDMGDQQPRTVLVLTGGQGYKCIREDTPTNGPPHNNTDAHLLVWEMKL